VEAPQKSLAARFTALVLRKAAQNFDVAKLLYRITCSFCEHTGIVACELPRHLTCSHCGWSGLIPAPESPASARAPPRIRTVKEGTGRVTLSRLRRSDSMDDRAETTARAAWLRAHRLHRHAHKLGPSVEGASGRPGNCASLAAAIHDFMSAKVSDQQRVTQRLWRIRYSQ
jgi:hypothetical protein